MFNAKKEDNNTRQKARQIIILTKKLPTEIRNSSGTKSGEQ
jgi:hypothetical protein